MKKILLNGKTSVSDIAGNAVSAGKMMSETTPVYRIFIKHIQFLSKNLDFAFQKRYFYNAVN